MNIYQIKEKLSASSYIVMGLVGTIAAMIIIPTYILTNVADRSNIETSNIIIDSIKFKITDIEYRSSRIDIWSNNHKYWIKGHETSNNYVMSKLKSGDEIEIKYGKSLVITSISLKKTSIYVEQDKIWLDITQFILMGAVFGFIAYWGAKTMRK